MARAMDNFRRGLRGVLDALTGETKAAVNQAAKADKAGTSYHADVELDLDLVGEVTEQADGGWDLKITGSAPVAGGAGVVTPEFGIGGSTTGQFGGNGNTRLRVRIALANATALAGGVDPNDPGEPGGGN